MSDSAFEARLAECVEALEAGHPVDAILARYPDDANRLRPILRTALALRAVDIPPHPAAQTESRRAFLTAAARVPPRTNPRAFPVSRAIGWLSVGLGLMALLTALFTSALPGQPLYGARRTIEEIRLVLAPGERAREDLLNQFEQTRIDEVRALQASGGEATVEFSGVIEAIQPDQWRVSGLVLTILPPTRLPDNPQIGQRVRVHAEVMNGEITAITITVVRSEPAATQLTITPSASPTGTATSPATSTPAPIVPNSTGQSDDDEDNEDNEEEDDDEDEEDD